MSVVVHVPSPLLEFTGGRRRIDAGRPRTVAELLGELPAGVRQRVLDETGAVRPHVNVFVGDTSIRETGQLATPLHDGDHVYIIPAVSGGR